MKKIALAMIFVGLIIAFNSCAWRVPEHITVKSKADYSFSLGTYEKELNSSDMDIESLMGDSPDGKAKVYDYFPGRTGATTQHYLLKFEFPEVDLGTEIPNLQSAIDALSDDVSLDLSTFSFSPLSGSCDSEFNPSELLQVMSTAFGENSVGNKIEFESVPVYFYCETVSRLSATITMSLNSTPITTNGTLRNCIIPEFPANKNETVYTNLAEASDKFAETSIEDEINSSSSNLVISYSISNLHGTITKQNIQNAGRIKIKIYAVIDVPLAFKVKNPTVPEGTDPRVNPNNIVLDLLDMTGNSNSSSGNDSNNSEMTKYTEIIESVAIKYKALSLPFYSTSGIYLGIDMLGNATSNTEFEWADLSVSSTEQRTLPLPYSTVRAMRSNLNFHPNIRVRINAGTHFSVPRDRSVRINVEMHFSTDGKIKVK